MPAGVVAFFGTNDFFGSAVFGAAAGALGAGAGAVVCADTTHALIASAIAAVKNLAVTVGMTLLWLHLGNR